MWASRAGSVGRTSRVCPPTTRLRPSRGVVGDHPAVVDDGDLVGQGVGLLQVLRGQQHGRAVRDQAADDVPHVLALGRVEAGGRLVQEDHLGAADQARGQVEAAAHAAGVGLGRPVGRVGQVEPLQQLGGPAPGAARGRGRAGCRTAPGSAGRSGPRRPRRTGRSGRSTGGPARRRGRRRSRRSGRARRPGSAGWTGCARRWSCRRRSGRARRARCRGGTARSTPCSALVAPKCLTRPSASITRSDVSVMVTTVPDGAASTRPRRWHRRCHGRRR